MTAQSQTATLGAASTLTATGLTVGTAEMDGLGGLGAQPAVIWTATLTGAGTVTGNVTHGQSADLAAAGVLTAPAVLGATAAANGLAAVDGTFIWTASHDQRQCSLSTVSFAAAIVVGPEPRSSWSAHSEARTNDLDGGENVSDQLDLPAGGCEDGAVAITEGDRTPRAAAPSFRADRRIFTA